ncbi:MAG TPA: hypothetical protein VG733_04720 [Chthoniobacteraceae bacterium]|nr:hypothetical protein [Chthoniobacteraceae bacterium]
MAEYSHDKAALIAQLEKARSEFDRSLAGVRHDADVGAHLKHSFSRHKAAWIGSAGIAGWLLSRLPARKKEVVIHKEGNGKAGKAAKDFIDAGLILSILKTLFSIFRPYIMRFATKKISDFSKKNERW